MRNIVKNGSKTLLISLLHCLYEAEDPSLCEFVADLLDHQLSLANITLKPIDCLAVGYFLSVASTDSGSTLVRLMNCSIGDQGCKFLVRGIYKCLNTQFKTTLELHFDDNNIHEEGIYHIAELLKSTCVVRILSLGLSHNPIGDCGLKTLCEALLTNTTVKQLEITYCSIENGGPFLCQLLSKNISLHCLDLPGNKITDCCSIATGLSKNSTLRQLQLRDCGLTDKCMEDLSGGLSNYIQNLNISRNDLITESGLNILLRRLSTLTEMSRLRLPAHLVSSISPVLKGVNEVRKTNRLPEIRLCGGYQLVS